MAAIVRFRLLHLAMPEVKRRSRHGGLKKFATCGKFSDQKRIELLRRLRNLFFTFLRVQEVLLLCRTSIILRQAQNLVWTQTRREAGGSVLWDANLRPSQRGQDAPADCSLIFHRPYLKTRADSAFVVVFCGRSKGHPFDTLALHKPH